MPMTWATYMYGTGTVGNAYVGTVFCGEAKDFLANTLGTYATPGVGVLPGNFATGMQVVNDSWEGSTPIYPNADPDALRRFDYMVNNQDVLSIAGFKGNGDSTPLIWAAYNTLGVVAEVGSEMGFDPQADATKQHADLCTSNLASFGSGIDAGYGVALYGNAQAAGQSSAQHSYVMRSLLLAGADKVDPGNGETVYVHPAAGAGGMDPYTGAGVADYNTSLSILQAGQKSLLRGCQRRCGHGDAVYRAKGVGNGQYQRRH